MLDDDHPPSSGRLTLHHNVLSELYIFFGAVCPPPPSPALGGLRKAGDISCDGLLVVRIYISWLCPRLWWRREVVHSFPTCPSWEAARWKLVRSPKKTCGCRHGSYIKEPNVRHCWNHTFILRVRCFGSSAETTLLHFVLNERGEMFEGLNRAQREAVHFVVQQQEDREDNKTLKRSSLFPPQWEPFPLSPLNHFLARHVRGERSKTCCSSCPIHLHLFFYFFAAELHRIITGRAHLQR